MSSAIDGDSNEMPSNQFVIYDRIAVNLTFLRVVGILYTKFTILLRFSLRDLSYVVLFFEPIMEKLIRVYL